MEFVLVVLVAAIVACVAYLLGKADGYAEGFKVACEDREDLMDKFEEVLHREIKP